MSLFFFVATALFVLMLLKPAQGIQVCHDYTLVRLFGGRGDVNRQSNPELLRYYLRYLKFERFGLAWKDPNKSQMVLKPGDVVLFGGGGHSGTVNGRTNVDHLLQRTPTNQNFPNMNYAQAEQWIVQNNTKDNTLFMVRQKMYGPNMKDAPLEVWRRAGRYQGFAVAGKNPLSGSFPTRGFTDSNDVDVWVPFHLWFGPCPKALEVKMYIDVKTIGQLVGTDALTLQPSGGQPIVVYDGFARLPGNQRITVEIDLTKYDPIMEAIRVGRRIDGVIQDDTAVFGVKIILAM